MDGNSTVPICYRHDARQITKYIHFNTYNNALRNKCKLFLLFDEFQHLEAGLGNFGESRQSNPNFERFLKVSNRKNPISYPIQEPRPPSIATPPKYTTRQLQLQKICLALVKTPFMCNEGSVRRQHSVQVGGLSEACDSYI